MSLIQPVSSSSSLNPIHLSPPEEDSKAPAEGESWKSSTRGPNKKSARPPPTSTLNPLMLFSTRPPLISSTNLFEIPTKPLSSPPLFRQPFPPILSPFNSVSFDADLPLELDQDPNLPQLEDGESDGGIVEERVMGLLRAVYKEAIAEGGGKGRSTRRRSRRGSEQLPEEEKRRLGVERRRSSIRTEDGALPKTPLEGEEVKRLGEEREVEVGRELEIGSWAGGGDEGVLWGEKTDFWESFKVLEDRLEGRERGGKMGDPVEVVFGEEQMELRSLEDGVGSLWV
ncbi:hypothetical protein BDY24DRAFT_386192 [Mrakia frigida]|uniref:uncharacterized protein n=1 Tax=Mrakia frigida TaxID=29902 RepID=UPI003FCC07F9